MSLSYTQALELTKVLRNQFNKYADIIRFKAPRKLDPPQEGYGLVVELDGNAPWSRFEEVRDFARERAGKDLQFLVIMTDKEDIGRDDAVEKFGGIDKSVHAPAAATFKKRPQP